MVYIKILIIGIVASGKSTLAKRLAVATGIKHYEIDSIVHNDLKNIKRSSDEQIEMINDINSNESWIIEGTLRKNLDILLEYADIIIFIDIPYYIRRLRIITRYIKQKLGFEECCYKPTLKLVKEMYRWTREFERDKEQFLMRISRFSGKLVCLKTVGEVNKYKISRGDNE